MVQGHAYRAMAGRPQGQGSRDLRERPVLDLDELRADPDEQPDIRDPHEGTGQ